ncbi:hypothetical protein HAX54_032492 [Datura stramonium]|uniref:Uncharacterized protein n=1 Tax=Datura stramonium TaxID=4076 RepID=A0ABS8VBS5_DATST|nr:hypothetical protein [Datura stramonium]
MKSNSNNGSGRNQWIHDKFLVPKKELHPLALIWGSSFIFINCRKADQSEDVGVGADGGLKKPPTDTLRPIILDNSCILYITAAAGTELANAYWAYSIYEDLDHSPQSQKLQHGWIDSIRPLAIKNDEWDRGTPLTANAEGCCQKEWNIVSLCWMRRVSTISPPRHLESESYSMNMISIQVYQIFGK